MLEKYFHFSPSEEVRFRLYWKLGIPTSLKKPTWWLPGEPIYEPPIPRGLVPRSPSYAISPHEELYKILGDREALQYERWLYQEKGIII